MRQQCPAIRAVAGQPGQIVDVARKPFLRKSDGRHFVVAECLDVFGAIRERHRRIDSDQLDARGCQPLERARVVASGPLERPQESENVLGLAVGLERCDPRLEAQSSDQLAEVEHDCRVVIRRKCILHNDDALVPLAVGKRRERIGGCFPHVPFRERAPQIDAVQRGQRNEPDLRQQCLPRSARQRRIRNRRHAGEPGQHALQRHHETITQRTQVAAVIQLEEA